MKTSLFSEIEKVLPEIPGWCDLEKAQALAAAVVALRPNSILEIGVFGGKSLLPMAMACEAVGKGVVYGIDPWSVPAAIEGYTGANAEWWQRVNLETIFRDFTKRVHTLGLQNRVVIHRARSDEIVPGADACYDLVHIDGQHTDQAERDVRRFASRVRAGGLCCLDDIGWVNAGTGTSVATALKALQELDYVELYRLGTGAMFQRVR